MLLFLIGFLLVGFLTFIVNSVSDLPNDSRHYSSDIDEPSKIDAWSMAEVYVKNYLKSPSTADFGGYSQMYDIDKRVHNITESTFVVRGWVDSQNSFGATVRTDFTVELE